MSADRNLLFGVLALQMDFIDREQLIAAMNAWVLEKSHPLGKVLLDQGAIAADTLAVLDSLVDKHVELHGAAGRPSLGSLSTLGGLRDDLAHLGDPDVEATLAHLTATDAAPAGNDVAQAEVTLGNPTSLGRRFTILRPLAKGGLGKVSVAKDQELGREVALKEIQDRYANDPACVSRFVLEAEVTGGLEHPGVVPVYGLGENSVGRPFYAMRLVRGDSLKHAIDRFFAEEGSRTRGERVLQLRHLLNRFIDVSNAMEYAHSRGVLHRDLKPSNIMLGKFGETVIVDWGVAKAVGRSESQSASGESTLLPTTPLDNAGTQVGAAIGTPQYMSPEQAAGQSDRLGPASDVYSLGATLYCILTGVAPFEEDNPSAVLRKVRAGDFDPPRKVSRQVPKPLDAVCRKAMKTDPHDRYASARELADDIEHWMADEPVSAYRESIAGRLGRWLRRRGAQATIGALVILTMFLIAGELMFNHARWLGTGAGKPTENQSQDDAGPSPADGATPNIQSVREELADALHELGMNLAATGSRAAARDALRRAVQTRRELVEGQPSGPAYVQLAASLAALAGVTDDASGGEGRQHAQQAIDALREAVKSGWSDTASLASDTAFDSIREHEGFKELLGASGR